jgi:hypothetical protein
MELNKTQAGTIKVKIKFYMEKLHQLNLIDICIKYYFILYKNYIYYNYIHLTNHIKFHILPYFCD